MRRLLCWLGFHYWWNRDERHRSCLRCPRQQARLGSVWVSYDLPEVPRGR